MKYGTIVNGRVTDPVTIPAPLPTWAADAVEFLEKMFPGKSGWVEVPDDAVPGTIANGDGTFTTNAAPAERVTPEKTALEIVLERLDSIEIQVRALTPGEPEAPTP